jgi:hypothetical protein
VMMSWLSDDEMLFTVLPDTDMTDMVCFYLKLFVYRLYVCIIRTQ